MTIRSPSKYFKTSTEIIRLAVMLYVRFPLSLRNVEDLLHERGIEVSHETFRFWWQRFGPMFASETPIAHRDESYSCRLQGCPIQIIPQIAPDIWTRHPDFHLFSMTVRKAQVQATASPVLADLLKEAEASVMQENAERDAHIAAWGEAYRGFGAKPNRTPCSAAALLKRSQKCGALPRISPLVDAYNAISVLYGVPVGGEDLDRYSGSPRLVVARGTEPVDTNQNGEQVIEHPDAGEIVWCDDEGVTCRRWNWRQGRRTMITARSSSLWLVLEALGPIAPNRLKEAGTRLADVISDLCPRAEISTRYIDRIKAVRSAQMD